MASTDSLAIAPTTDLSYLTSTATAGGSNDPKTAADLQQRFLTLLVAQLKNQDPLNPMDNAQTTTQMAQINTVAGIEKLNATMAAMSTQSQGVAGSSLLGKSVAVPGNTLALRSGEARGGVQLDNAADTVQVDVLGSNGQVIDSVNLGAQKAGIAQFSWSPPGGLNAPDGSYKFRVSASYQNTPITATALSLEKVDSVLVSATGMQLGLASGGKANFADVQLIQS
ncbi:flagellar hook assembly protein FlgD [Amphibiibacter pelophylacis]|uniref:Flagellar hook capping FlgD N-terminal domain-containing protein n=1 Tax=Amphibiibacter pelophylacis TaxID=1799477 RepID=A0ACC6P0W8_9BURK